jgi:hypothetical protein
MEEKKATTKKAATKEATEKKTTVVKKTTAKKTSAATAEVAVTAENAGFKAGDVYQTLAAAQAPMTVAGIAKAANITTEEVYLGIGWLMKEGKVKGENNAIVLA